MDANKVCVANNPLSEDDAVVVGGWCCWVDRKLCYRAAII